jgi:hypothetical protein
VLYFLFFLAMCQGVFRSIFSRVFGENVHITQITLLHSNPLSHKYSPLIYLFGREGIFCQIQHQNTTGLGDWALLLASGIANAKYVRTNKHP